MTEPVIKGPHTHVVRIFAPDGWKDVFLDVAQGDPHSHYFTVDGERGESTIADDHTGGHAHFITITQGTFQSDGPITAIPTFTIKEKPMFPEVLTYEAVRARQIPPLGESGLPPSLEQDIPGEYRYWKCACIEDAVLVRDALVSTNMFTPESVREVSVRRDGEIIGKELRRVVIKETQQVVLMPAEDGEPVVPNTIPYIDKASEIAGLDNPYKMTSDMVDFFDNVGDALKRVSTKGRDWIIEVRTDGADYESLGKRADRCTVFKLHETDAYTYYSSGIPGEDSVRWCYSPSDSAVALLKSRQNLSHKEISELIRDVAVPTYVADLACGVAEAVAKESPTQWDNRIASRALLVLDAELKKSVELMNGDVLRGLGVDLHKAESIMEKIDSIKIYKRSGEERIVYGVVLEPGTVDLQDDIYSEEDVRQAMYSFMETGCQKRGLQHDELILDKTVLLETFIAPCDFIPDGSPTGESIKKGSWVIAERIKDDDLWDRIKSGEFTGFSIGGRGRRIPLQ